MEKVLVVEDEWLEATEIQGMLEDLGYETTEVVSSGEEAIESVDREKPDVVLMDIHLDGDLDGIEAAASISESHDVSVVYLTAYSDDETLTRAKENHPADFLVKPITGEDLKSTLQMLEAR